MPHEWLLALGVGLCRVVIAWQLRSDWIRHGLTWVRYRTLIGLLLASLCLALWGAQQGAWAVLILGGGPGLLDVWLLWLKLSDLLLTRRHVRRRSRRGGRE